MYRVGIIGCGNISKVHAKALVEMEHTELCALGDCNLEKAKALAYEFKDKSIQVYQSLEEMIRHGNLHAIHICSPHFLHVPMAILALEHNINVFMEKPPAITREQFFQLKEVEKRSKGILGFCFQNRYNPTTKKVDEILSKEDVGAILGARAFVTWHRDEAYYENSDWRGVKVLEGGSALINQAIHTLDLLVRWLGCPVETVATARNHHLPGIIESEDTVEAYIRFQTHNRETRAVLFATKAYVEDAPVLIEIACEHATMRLEGDTVTCTYQNGQHATFNYFQKQILGKMYWGSGHEACIRDFYDSIEQGYSYGNRLSTIEDTFFEMLDIYESAEQGQRILFMRPEN